MALTAYKCSDAVIEIAKKLKDPDGQSLYNQTTYEGRAFDLFRQAIANLLPTITNKNKNEVFGLLAVIDVTYAANYYDMSTLTDYYKFLQLTNPISGSGYIDNKLVMKPVDFITRFGGDANFIPSDESWYWQVGNRVYIAPATTDDVSVEYITAPDVQGYDKDTALQTIYSRDFIDKAIELAVQSRMAEGTRDI